MDPLEVLRSKLGLPSAPLVLSGLQQVVTFFRAELHADPEQWIDYLRGIDFHQPIESRVLPPGTRLSQHESTGARRQKPFVYFTVPGTSPTSTGTSFPQTRFKLFVTARPVPVLISVAGSISFNNVAQGSFDRTSRAGGGKQLIMSSANAANLLTLQ